MLTTKRTLSPLCLTLVLSVMACDDYDSFDDAELEELDELDDA